MAHCLWAFVLINCKSNFDNLTLLEYFGMCVLLWIAPFFLLLVIVCLGNCSCHSWLFDFWSNWGSSILSIQQKWLCQLPFHLLHDARLIYTLMTIFNEVWTVKFWYWMSQWGMVGLWWLWCQEGLRWVRVWELLLWSRDWNL